MTDKQAVKVTRTLLPLLDGLLGAAAPEVRRKLNRLLAQAAKPGVKGIAEKILELLAGYPALRKWLRAEGVLSPAAKSVAKPAVKRAAPAVRAGGVKAAARKKPAPAARVTLLGANLGDATVPPRLPVEEIGNGGEPPPTEQAYQIVTIHYGTDRKSSGKKDPSKFFTGDRAPKGKMSYGTCDVSIPADHKKGMLESPSWKKLEFRQNPAKHVVLLKIEALDPAAFFSSAANGGKQAFVFVHGFNVTFEDAARRTAQIAYDLPFDGVPILYSWPSVGSESPIAYTTDEATAEWSIPHLQKFLEDLATQGGFTTLHVIAHSMGNRVVTRALQQIGLQGKVKAAFHQILLTAPDIDAETFEDLAKEFLPVAQRVTLYASATDVALKFSKTLHHQRRAGDAEGGVLVVAGMDSVDATGVDTSFLGHSYFGSDRSVLTDVYYALRGDPAAARKATLRPSKAGTYYEFIL